MCEGSILYTPKLEYKNTDVANLGNCTKSYLVPAKLVYPLKKLPDITDMDITNLRL